MAASREAKLDAVRDMVYERVAKKMEGISEVGNCWTRDDAIKRIVRYIVDAALKTSNDGTWDAYVENLVSAALTSFHASCGKLLWFWQMEFGYLLGNVAWEMLDVDSLGVTPSWEDVSELTYLAWEAWMAEAWRGNAIWNIVTQLYNDNEVMKKTLYNGVQKTHKSALMFVLNDTRRLRIPRHEQFVTRWVEEALWFWAASPNNHFVLTEDVVIALFHKLVVLLEDVNNLWCMLAFRLNGRGRPPMNWERLTNTICVLFASATSASFPKRRRT